VRSERAGGRERGFGLVNDGVIWTVAIEYLVTRRDSGHRLFHCMQNHHNPSELDIACESYTGQPKSPNC